MPPEPPPESELERWADAQLKPVEEVSATQAYMTTGRRPMRKYPLILLTVPDLIEIRELYEKSKIPPEEFSRPFLKVKARLDAEMQKGAEPWRKDAKSWLIGWAYQESMRELKAQNDLQRSESWLNGSAS